MKKSKSIQADALLAAYALRFAGLKQQFDTVTYFCKGTVLKRMMKCGQRRCACHQDPAKRHGPYFEWTYKEKGKTVNRRLSPEEAPIYEAATQEYRKIQSLMKQMGHVSRKALLRLALKSVTKQN